MGELNDNLNDELDKIVSNKNFDDTSKQLGEASRELRRSQVDMFKQLQLHASAITRHAQALDSICHFLIKAFEDME